MCVKCKNHSQTIHLQRATLKTKTLMFKNGSLVTNNNTKEHLCFSLYMKSPCFYLKKNRHGHTKRERRRQRRLDRILKERWRRVGEGCGYLRNVESVKRNEEMRSDI